MSGRYSPHIIRRRIGHALDECNIAAGSLMVDSPKFDVSSVTLDLPENVKRNLKELLPTFLNAVQIDGYQTSKKMKAFVVGNTGRYL